MGAPPLPITVLREQNGHIVADPHSHFKAHDLDTENDPSYWGNVSPDGSWFILKGSNRNANGEFAMYRFVQGSDGYPAAWAARAAKAYSYLYLLY